jgi:death-on-curing protein
MIKITKEKAIELHARLCALTGGDPGIRDEGLLESALEAPYQTFDAVELYPTPQERRQGSATRWF